VSRLSFMSAARDPARLEVRGPVDALQPTDGERLLPLGPDRALLVGARAGAPERLAADGYLAYDMTAALTTVELEGEDLLRRLTDLVPEQLPAVGSVARGTPALVERLGDERFRLYVPRELAEYVTEVVADLEQGLGR
jgi:sarcosine oxidase gamma subunit